MARSSEIPALRSLLLWFMASIVISNAFFCFSAVHSTKRHRSRKVKFGKDQKLDIKSNNDETLRCNYVVQHPMEKKIDYCNVLRTEAGILSKIVCKHIVFEEEYLEVTETFQVVEEQASNNSSTKNDVLFCLYLTRCEKLPLRSPKSSKAEFIYGTACLKYDSYIVDSQIVHSRAMGIVKLDVDCTSCKPEVWISTDLREMEFCSLNNAWRVSIHHYNRESSFCLLPSFEKSPLIEEIYIHGGEYTYSNRSDKFLYRHLKKIEITDCKLHQLFPDFFEKRPNLIHINVSDNELETFRDGFDSLTSLQTLDLSNNPIEKSSFRLIIQNLLQLKILRLSMISSLDSLDILESDDKINNLKKHHRDKNQNSQLQVLDVSNCNILNVDTLGTRQLFEMLKNLEVLHLSGNPLTRVPKDLAQQLPALRELHLSRCLLRSPPALTSWRFLKLLDLSRNLLETPQGVLVGRSDVDIVVDMSENPLRSGWGAHAFALVGRKVTLNLSRTKMPVFTRSMLEALEALDAVDLGGNAFDCSNCSILVLQHWLKNRLHPQILRPPECKWPLAEGGRPVQEVSGPQPELCALPPVAGSWSGVAVGSAGAVTALLVIGAIVLISIRFRLELTYILHVLRANRAVKDLTGTDAECEFDAFVCYSKHDRSWVLGELLPRLEGDNPRYRLCLHERDFPLGSFIVQNIVECMARSRHTIMILTKAFVDSQWCRWELEMATHHLLEGAGNDFLVLVELEPLERSSLPRLLRLLVETRTFLQWPSALVNSGAPGAGVGCFGGGREAAEKAAWKRLREALGPPINYFETEEDVQV